MSAAPPQPIVPPATSWRTVALPVEHGGWGLLAEPLLLGLVLAPTVAGAGLTVAALGAFLARHPVRLVLSDRRRDSANARTALAAKVAAGYALLAIAGLALAAARAPAVAFWPLLVAAPLGLLQLAYDVRLQGRQLLPQLAGGIALGAGAPVLMLAGGWGLAPALAVWTLLSAKAITSVLYVRARLRLDRDQSASRGPVLLAHAAALAGAWALAGLGFGPWLAVVAFVVLLVRAAYGLSSWRRRVRPQVLGFTELGYGILTVVLIATGYLARA